MSCFIRALLLTLLGALLLPAPALANRPPLDPEIRLHVGPSLLPGPSGFGGMLGMDSRLTRVISMDMGGMFSPVGLPETFAVSEALDPRHHFRVRHAIYVAPGFRPPHRQPMGFHWDLVLRMGAAMIWSTDVSESQVAMASSALGRRLEFDTGGVAGLELLIMQPPRLGLGNQGRWGVKLSGRALVYMPFFEDDLKDIVVWQPQGALELVYQAR